MPASTTSQNPIEARLHRRLPRPAQECIPLRERSGRLSASPFLAWPDCRESAVG
jgi:hypothetical protein